MKVSSPGRAILLFLAVFLLLMILLPLLHPYGSFTDLDGRAGVIDNWSKLSFADPLSRGVYFLGDLFCHQETSRSFIINGSQMAFCQRDVSILTGAIVGLIATDEKISVIPIKNKTIPLIGVLMIVSTLIEWGIEFVFNVDLLAGRVATGLLAGAGIALIFQYFITKEYEKVVFKRD
ncbi:hypothetical protein Mpt1_c05380 [Candidatus Methanoplasma termitum]|uniref:DUF2085 domain-containing protein n=1 Tax=Candidatus Methanoplasma termitum TaxID=1577791 RepID=A0A0A7LBN5_9ARCH|nr:DUF2085 domain-containing protein [Candidatus Methanoplasma termitum]AIZ56428.1 hypothetical protein Mpt1_c05380 [Candidatus Methanoplasma termitum]